jgi:recombination protein RecT
MKLEKTEISEFFRNPEILQRFTELLGQRGKSYVESVLIAVSDSDSLSACTPQSIFRSALRAASLELSCDPSAREAYLIARNKKVKAVKDSAGKIIQPERWEKRAEFQPHYHGLYNLAMRTGKYWVINVSPVYEGSDVYENTLTGLHTVITENGLPTANAQLSGLRKVSDRVGKRTIGWLGYFKTTKGAEKSVYMTVEEIEKHASIHSPGYANDDSLWAKNSKHRGVMEMKTVLISLLKWADMSGKESEKLRDAMKSVDDPAEHSADGEDFVDGDASDVTTPVSRSEAEADQPKEEIPSASSKRPYSPADFKAAYDAAVTALPGAYEKRKEVLEATDTDKKVLASALDGILGGPLERHEFMSWLVGKDSTKDMTPAEIKTLLHIMGVKTFNDPPSAVSITEIRACHASILKK